VSEETRNRRDDDILDDDEEEIEDLDERDERRGRGRGGPGGRGRRSRSFYAEQIQKAKYLDYKNTDLLKLFITERGKIRPRRQTGISAKQQRAVARAVKRARHMALLPFVGESERE